jgi:predicted ATPase/DNA-binding CsgD family transcriptional regulator
MDGEMLRRSQTTLTGREYEVLSLIADGLSNDAIAERLSLSPHTVAWHIKQIFSKLAVNRRTRAVAVARAFGLLSATAPVSPVRTALPAPSTVLVGRQAELKQTLAVLRQPETRLLTILGPGGIGKTRLALAAGAVWERRASAVHFAPLEGIRSVEHIIPALAEALGLQFRGQIEARLQLLAHLRSRTLLLILDNCEHLLEAVPFFAEMLENCADLKILATSRERLNQRGERVLLLGGLPYPQDLQHEEQSEAVELFLQTARRIGLRFEPDEEDLRHIRRICQMVEGMPLAIELAAGWINELSPAQIAHEIDVSPAILETTTRDAPARQRSMQAVFAHSWDLLTEVEQAVFKKLSVFRGGFGRTAAEQVTGTSLSTLKLLIDKSFVRPEGQGRYSVHELLRQLGAEKLAAASHTQQETRLSYARYYLSRLYERQRELEGANLPVVISDFRKDIDNIWAAWRMGGEYGLALEIAQATRSFTILHTSTGLVPNLVQEIEYILPYLRAQPHLPFVNLAVARTLIMLSPAYARHLPEKTLQLVDEAAVHLDRLENPPDIDVAVYYTFRGTALMAVERYELAVDELQTAFAICRRIKDDTIAWWVPINLSVSLIGLDRYQEAQDCLETAQNTVECFTPFFLKAYVWPLLALTSIGLKRYEDVCPYLIEAVAENRRYPQLLAFEVFLIALATYLHRTGSFEPALEMLYMYFQPACVHLFLHRKAGSLLNELEAQLPLDTRQSISQRAEEWLSESPTPQNTLGLRPGFLDYAAQLIQRPLQA